MDDSKPHRPRRLTERERARRTAMVRLYGQAEAERRWAEAEARTETRRAAGAVQAAGRWAAAPWLTPPKGAQLGFKLGA